MMFGSIKTNQFAKYIYRDADYSKGTSIIILLELLRFVILANYM